MYGLNSDEELNGDFGTEDHVYDRGNDNIEPIPRATVQPIKNNKKNKPPNQTVMEKFLKATYNKETNKEDKDETMDTSYN